MKIQSAREDVRAGQAFETEVGAVCASPDRLDLRFDAGHLDCLDGFLDDVVVRFDLLSHIIILVANFGGSRSFAVFPVDERNRLADNLFLPLKFRAVMVPDDIGEVRVLDRALELD